MLRVNTETSPTTEVLRRGGGSPCPWLLFALTPVPETFKWNKVDYEIWLDLTENLTENTNWN